MKSSQYEAIDNLNSGADIYGGYGILDEVDKLYCIEVRYHCPNCHSVMTKNVTTESQSKEPIKCLFCKLTVNPLQLQ